MLRSDGLLLVFLTLIVRGQRNELDEFCIVSIGEGYQGLECCDVRQSHLPTHAVLRTSMVSLAQVNSFVDGSFSAFIKISVIQCSIPSSEFMRVQPRARETNYL